MSDDVTIEIDIKGLEKLAKAFDNIPELHIGILDGSQRMGQESVAEQPSNAQIGLWHEFGTTKMPMRSYLRMPLIRFLDKEIQKAEIFNRQAINEAIRSGSMLKIVQQIGIVAEGIVLDAFDTGGFGEWAPLAPETLAKKTNNQILVETQQLRNSIATEVVKGEGE